MALNLYRQALCQIRYCLFSCWRRKASITPRYVLWLIQQKRACVPRIWIEFVMLNDPVVLKPGINDHRTVVQASSPNFSSNVKAGEVCHMQMSVIISGMLSLSLMPFPSTDQRLPCEKQRRNLNTWRDKKIKMLFISSFPGSNRRENSWKVTFWDRLSKAGTLHSLALPLAALAWSLLRDLLVVNVPSAPDRAASGFEMIAGFCSPDQPEDRGLFLLLFIYARLGFLEVAIIHHEDIGGQWGFHFLINGLAQGIPGTLSSLGLH